MAKEILIYGDFFNFSAGMFMQEMEEAKDDDIVLRINSDGGDPEAAFGMISKVQDHPGLKTIKVDGTAKSMGAFFLAYVDSSECLDVSTFLFHRAAFPEFMEASEHFFTADKRMMLENMNKNLRAALEAKVDVPRFEKIAKVTMDELFSMESRINVVFNAKQAKQVKLINKINPITPQIAASINSQMEKIAAKHVGKPLEVPTPQSSDDDPTTKLNVENKNTDMDLNKLKSEHPALYAQIHDMGMTAGVSQEKERIGAWMVFADIDLKAVSEGINGDKGLSPVDLAELTRKGISAKVIGGLEEDKPADVDTPAGADAKDKDKPTAEAKAFQEEVYGNLGLKAE